MNQGLRAAAEGRWGQLFSIDAISLLKTPSQRERAEPQFRQNRASQIENAQTQLHKAFNSLRLVVHPDKNHEAIKKDAEAYFEAVTKAYELAKRDLDKHQAALAGPAGAA